MMSYSQGDEGSAVMETGVNDLVKVMRVVLSWRQGSMMIYSHSDEGSAVMETGVSEG